jgi:1-deoxy-D-xylulose-5-phosphate reductoisomerase
MKRVSVLGATGSIGQNTLDLVARAPQDYRVVALTGGRNIDRLARDARRFGAELAVTSEPGLLPGLRAALEGSGIEAAAGPQALCEAAARPADWVMSAIVGFAGLAPGLAALRQGATLALANKESMVAAGPLVLATARASGARVLPVDSEHSAVFQALAGEDMASVETVTITASGGAFRDWPLERLRHATPEEAATHPNWDMGQRITVDSASMFNKALEFLETKEFFSLDPARIKVLIHPESLLHAIVTHVDGGMIAHVGPHDMRHAIGYALHWPERRPPCDWRARSRQWAVWQELPSTAPRKPRSTPSSPAKSPLPAWPRWSRTCWTVFRHMAALIVTNLILITSRWRTRWHAMKRAER